MEKKSYLDTQEKKSCSGCRACEQICKRNAITMIRDEEGFSYPHIDKEICVECDACRSICPMSKESDTKTIIKVYELQNKNTELLKRSSSGGVFISLAKYVLDNNGIVFGAILDEDNNAVIVSTDNKVGLEKMHGSKYVSSDSLNTYSEVEKELKDKKLVLFTGAPCQVAGLKCFLKKDYENLITMDFLCHGMPSAEVFKENIKFLSKKYKGVVSDYKFRDKSLKGWGLVTSFYVNKKKYFESGKLNAYFCGFIKGYLNRYSCYSCPFRGENRYSDITVGDFWGCDDRDLDVRKGVSFAVVNTAVGERVFEKIKEEFFYKETDAESVAKMNSSLLSSESESIPEIRKNIYKVLNNEGYASVVNKYLKSDKRLLLKTKMILDIVLNKLSIRK